MDNWKFIVSIFGLFFAYYLHTRTINRGEIARVKEQLIKSLRDFPDWASKVLKEYQPDELQLEEYISAQASIIEFQVNNLNKLSGCCILDPDRIASLRNLDCSKSKLTDPLKFNFSTFQVCADLIGVIEDNYAIHLFQHNMIKRLFIKRKPEILGVTCTAAILSLFFMLYQMYK